ncbi:MAG: winged helix-turn-helix domain-containing protein [Selenomonadaceae bacterium]|nr:winged helix-turn-helix domain-containing protein [Selenomonadaceae bacterium]
MPIEKVRGRKVGKGRRLPQEKSDEIKAAIIKYKPDYFKLPYSLWSREAIKELIELKLKKEMPLRTITSYLQLWGMKCQRPAKRATKQNEVAVKEFQEATFPEIVSKAKKEGGMILFGDETGICNQENYQDEYLNNMLKKNVHSGELPHIEKQLEKKTIDFMNNVVIQPEKISFACRKKSKNFLRKFWW